MNSPTPAPVPVAVQNRDGLPIHGDLHLPAGEGPFPLILVAHGFKGFKDWGFFPWLAESFANRGLAAFRFNFARNGVAPDRPLDFTRLDLFEENSISREIADLEDLAAAIPGHSAFAGTDTSGFDLFGHSRGGGVAIHFAAREPRVRSLVTWASVSRFNGFFPPEALDAWKEEGRFSVLNARTGQQMPLGMELWRDLVERTEELDVLAAEARLRIPHRIVHGEEDEAVPASSARELHAAAGGRATLVLVPGTGHTFGAVHPFAGPTEALMAAESTPGDGGTRPREPAPPASGGR